MTRRALLFRFCAVALPLMLTLFILHAVDMRMERERWSRQMANAVEHAHMNLASRFHEVAADTLALAADSEFRASLNTLGATHMDSRFEALARFKPDYRQIRYIDESGKERLRFDTTADGVARIPESALQVKADRDYFREAIDLPDGAVRISRLDLNIERGRIETPYNPMLRFSSPVFDTAGKKRGVIVINFGVAPLLDRLERTALPEGGSVMLINAKGSLLAGGEPLQRWGDVLGNDNGFAQERPQAWAQLLGKIDAGSAQWQEGNYQYAHMLLHPVDAVRGQIPNSTAQISSADPWWVIVSEADQAVVDAASLARWRTGLVFASIALAIWAFSLVGWRRLKRAAFDANRRIQQLARVVEQTSDLVFITSPKGKIEYVNPAFVQATGYSADEAIGQTPALLRSGQHPPSFYQALWADILQGKQFRDMFVNRRRDGTLFYEEKTISPLTDTTGHLNSYVSTGKDVTDSKLTRMAFHDHLTGLVNRPLFMDRLQHEMTHAQRMGKHMAILYMDLDGFKAINDSLGHRAGDEILCEFARRTGGLMRKSDTLARLGGDEFAMLLRDIDKVGDAEHVANKIVTAVQETWQVGEAQVELGVSIGIVLFPQDDVDSAGLLERADAAMYEAKRNGRNHYAVHAGAQPGDCIVSST